MTTSNGSSKGTFKNRAPVQEALTLEQYKKAMKDRKTHLNFDHGRREGTKLERF